MTRRCEIVLAACLIVSSVGCDPKGPTAPTPQAAATGLAVLAVTRPQPTDDVDGPTIPVEGTWQNVSGDIWVVVRPQMAADVVFPQSDNAPAGTPATKNAGGTWSVRATLGGPQQFFDLFAVTADANTLRQLSDAVKVSGTVPFSTISSAPFTLSPAIRVTRRPFATFSEPAGDTTIPAATTLMTVRGRFTQGIGEDIWLLIVPALAPDTAFPQSPNAAAGLPARKDGLEWSVPVSFGGDPQSYQLRVYTANRDASAVLADNLRASVVSRNFGIPVSTVSRLAGLFLQSTITVTRQ